MVHPFSTHVETAEEVAAIAEQPMGFVPKERITLTLRLWPRRRRRPRCAHRAEAESRQHPGGMDEAYPKLLGMCEGAALLRERHS